MKNLLKYWIFYSSISLAGSGSVYRIRIRIQLAIFKFLKEKKIKERKKKILAGRIKENMSSLPVSSMSSSGFFLSYSMLYNKATHIFANQDPDYYLIISYSYQPQSISSDYKTLNDFLLIKRVLILTVPSVPQSMLVKIILEPLVDNFNPYL